MKHYTVRMTPDAEADLDALEPWWQTYRLASKNPNDEVERVIDLLATMPFVGNLREGLGVPGLRRYRLRPSPYFIYYLPDEQAQELVILAFWSGMLPDEPSF